MKISLIHSLVLCGVAVLAVACQPTVKTTDTQSQEPVIVQDPLPRLFECKIPRPEVCTFQYQPVCASKDTGVRCFKAPCPATEMITYGSACSACADERVFGYIDGECKK